MFKVIDVVLMCLSLTLNIFQTFFYVSIVDFEQVNVSWEVYLKLSIQDPKYKVWLRDNELFQINETTQNSNCGMILI